jgi:hypothetical protein
VQLAICNKGPQHQYYGNLNKIIFCLGNDEPTKKKIAVTYGRKIKGKDIFEFYIPQSGDKKKKL